MKNIIEESQREEFLSELYRIFKLNGMEKYLENGNDQKFFTLARLMTEFNAHTNLTAITDIRGVILRHFADSLTAEPYIPKNARLADIGTGGGFPTLPLAIVRDDISITAIDSTEKKLRFSSLAAEALGLGNVRTLAGRAEELQKTHGLRESFDCVCARAVAALNILSELCLPYVKVGGKFVALKGMGAEDELALAKNGIEKLGGKVVGAFSCDITEDAQIIEKRYIIETEKVKPCPAQYPRMYSKIKSKPL